MIKLITLSQENVLNFFPGRRKITFSTVFSSSFSKEDIWQKTQAYLSMILNRLLIDSLSLNYSLEDSGLYFEIKYEKFEKDQFETFRGSCKVIHRIQLVTLRHLFVSNVEIQMPCSAEIEQSWRYVNVSDMPFSFSKKIELAFDNLQINIFSSNQTFFYSIFRSLEKESFEQYLKADKQLPRAIIQDIRKKLKTDFNHLPKENFYPTALYLSQIAELALIIEPNIFKNSASHFITNFQAFRNALENYNPPRFSCWNRNPITQFLDSLSLKGKKKISVEWLKNQILNSPLNHENIPVYAANILSFQQREALNLADQKIILSIEEIDRLLDGIKFQKFFISPYSPNIHNDLMWQQIANAATGLLSTLINQILLKSLWYVEDITYSGLYFEIKHTNFAHRYILNNQQKPSLFVIKQYINAVILRCRHNSEIEIRIPCAWEILQTWIPSCYKSRTQYSLRDIRLMNQTYEKTSFHAILRGVLKKTKQESEKFSFHAEQDEEIIPLILESFWKNLYDYSQRNSLSILTYIKAISETTQMAIYKQLRSILDSDETQEEKDLQADYIIEHFYEVIPQELQFSGINWRKLQEDNPDNGGFLWIIQHLEFSDGIQKRHNSNQTPDRSVVHLNRIKQGSVSPVALFIAKNPAKRRRDLFTPRKLNFGLE